MNSETTMRSDPYTIIGLGELLWDLMPGGRQLGGAPANFAYHAAALGDRGIIASRLGNDKLGQEALDRLEQVGLPAECIQIDTKYPTGTVQVQVGQEGQPEFTITKDVAWDFLEWTPALQELAAKADAVCFGSLAQRSPRSRRTIRRFLQTTRRDCLRVFDVNLRPSFHSPGTLSQSLNLSDIAKLNDEELPRVMETLHLAAGSTEASAGRMIQVYRLALVCVTRGAEGCLLVTSTETVQHAGFQVEVVDTVGSGDAFTAALVHHYLRNVTLERIAEAANRLGSWVATQAGGTPPPSPHVLNQVIGAGHDS